MEAKGRKKIKEEGKVKKVCKGKERNSNKQQQNREPLVREKKRLSVSRAKKGKKEEKKDTTYPFSHHP